LLSPYCSGQVSDSDDSGLKDFFEPILQLRPFCDHDRIKRRVSDRAVFTRHICSPDTLELGTESLDGTTGALVSDIGSQADAMNLPGVEGMGKKKIFGFRIAAGPLRRGSKPGVSDFKGVRPIQALKVTSDGPFPGLEVIVTGGSDDSTAPDDGKGDALLGSLLA
jgi:hypothetical protein